MGQRSICRFRPPRLRAIPHRFGNGTDGRTFNPAEVDSIQPRADRIWMSGIKKALLNGDTDNVTGIMNNPGFTGSKDGWKYDFVSGDNKFNYGYNMGEVYQTVCDVYQELEGLPNGTYEVTLQGSTARHGMAPAHPHGAWKAIPRMTFWLMLSATTQKPSYATRLNAYKTPIP